MAWAVQDLVIFMAFFQTLRLPLAPPGAAWPRGRAGPRPAGPTGPPGAGPGLEGGGSLLAGGEASVIDPAGPAESDSDWDRDNESDSTGPLAEGQGLPGGSDPENSDQTDEEEDPGEYIGCN